MKKIGLTEIEEGLILAREIVNEQNQLLLSEGAVIKKEHMEKFLENGIFEIYVEEPEKNPVLTMELKQIEDECISRIRDTIENRLESDDMNEISEIASGIIRDALLKPGMKECMLDIKRDRTDIYSHLISTAVMSVIMAVKLNFRQEQLMDIAVGALLHDIGLRDVEVKYENVEVNSLPSEEKLEYRVHVLKGYEQVRKLPWITQGACEVILSHHEKSDGSGYPFHKDKTGISKSVKLVSICDVLDEKVNGIGYKKKKVHEVVEYFRTTGTYEYDYPILSKVLQNLAWFTTGAVVKTNDGETARVIRQNKGLPDRPVIKIIRDKNGNEVGEEIVKDLTKCLTVFITDTLE